MKKLNSDIDQHLITQTEFIERLEKITLKYGT